MDYKELKKIDCKKYIEKKGKFNYLSWPFMVDMLRIYEPEATIHARINQDGLPYFKDESGGLVETYIMLNGIEMWNEWLPIMDFKNKALKNPDTMDINKAIQRCKAKCISEYTGIGLYIYMGEDLPDSDQDVSKKPPLDPFLSSMKMYATNHKKEYWDVMNDWGMKEAKRITNPESQEHILDDIANKIGKKVKPVDDEIFKG